jgi:hypothetical protein
MSPIAAATLSRDISAGHFSHAAHRGPERQPSFFSHFRHAGCQITVSAFADAIDAAAE